MAIVRFLLNRYPLMAEERRFIAIKIGIDAKQPTNITPTQS